MVKHDPAGLPLAGAFKFTENTATIRDGDQAHAIAGHGACPREGCKKATNDGRSQLVHSPIPAQVRRHIQIGHGHGRGRFFLGHLWRRWRGRRLGFGNGFHNQFWFGFRFRYEGE